MATPRITHTRRQSAVNHLIPRTRRAALTLACELVLIALHPPLAVAHVAVSLVVHGLPHRRRRR